MTGDVMPDAVPLYAEDGCARRWPLLLLGLGMPVLMVLCLVGGLATGDQGFALLFAIPLFTWVFTDARLVGQYWPTGIRIDGAGIRIGGVRRAQRHRGDDAEARAPRRKPPPPSFQCYHVFSVPWTGVQSLTVVTDRKELRRLRKQSRQGPKRGMRARGHVAGFWLGMLVPPFVRAALVIEVDPESADFPEFREVRAAISAQATSQVGTRSSIWVVPTRHPVQLQMAVEQITHSPEWNVR